LRQLFYDTVVFDPLDLEVLVRRYGSDHILLGTDYPYDMGEDDPIGLVASVQSLNDEDRKNILGANASRLLRLG
jgi:aminocarboxymuconate-semialdehyde decarboxylase